MNKIIILLIHNIIISYCLAQIPNAIENPNITWSKGATMGVIKGGKAIGIINGKGKLDFHMSGAHITGDVKADGNGEIIYSNVSSGITTSDYWDGFRSWEPGTVIGLVNKDKDIGVVSGKGKLDFHMSGAHITGDVKAEGKGIIIYSNVTSGTTTSEYWNGSRMWEPGTVIGLINKGKDIGVISGKRKSDK